MIYLFVRHDQHLREFDRNAWADLDQSALMWVDASNPTPEEQQWLIDTFELPRLFSDDEFGIEASARIVEPGDGSIQISSDFLVGKKQSYATSQVQLVLHRNILFTLHEAEIGVIRLMRMRCIDRQTSVIEPLDLMVELLGMDVEHSADALESIYAELKVVSDAILSKRHGNSADAADNIALIARQEDLNGTIRLNLMETRRALSALARMPTLSKQRRQKIDRVVSDIDSLDGHSSFLFDKLNFLMDTTISFVSISQNNVVKIFSVASVAMLPPTLIASIYGMNFEKMPELTWRFGYPFSIALMIISVAVPFYYFNRKGWLK